MKSYVGITQCYYCGGDSEIIMDTKLRDVFEKKVGIISMEPCNQCKEYMEQGIIIIGVKDNTPVEEFKEEFPNPYRTGQFLVVKDIAIEDLLEEGELLNNILENRFTFMEETVLKEMFGLNTPE